MKIIPFLWFDTQAIEAMNFYVSVFSNSRVNGVDSFDNSEAVAHVNGVETFNNSGPDEKQTVDVVSWNLNGLEMMGMNAGPYFKPNPSISFFVKCATKEEVTHYYNKLIEGGSALMELGKYDWSEHYGWVTDKYGFTWQIMHDTTNTGTPTISPSLLYTGVNFGKAEKALNLYTSLFQSAPLSRGVVEDRGVSRIDVIQRYPEGSELAGKILYSECTLDGTKLIIMEGPGSHDFVFNEAISLSVETADQAETDYLWNGLIADDGEESQCGWLKDVCGVSWQITPKVLNELQKIDKSGRVMHAMLGMQKIIVSEIEAAYRGE